MWLTNLERLTILRLDAEIRASQYKLQLTKDLLGRYLEKVDPQGRIAKMNKEISDWTERNARWAGEYQAALQKIRSERGIDLAEYTFDDETGALSLVDPIPNEELNNGDS